MELIKKHKAERAYECENVTLVTEMKKTMILFRRNQGFKPEPSAGTT